MAYYGRYGRGLDSFVREWGLDNIGDKEFDPVVLEALQAVLDATSPERGYILSFVPTGTAATSFSSKRVIITSEALRGKGIVDLDRWASNEARALAWSRGKRFRISAGMVCHEVSHVRYGQDTAGAVDRAYKGHPNLRLAQRISNILDDTRIEAAFAWDFPGFGKSLFDDVLEWVARKSRKSVYTRDTVAVVKDRNDALNAMLLGSRYERQYFWPTDSETLRCRDFGAEWAKKYTRDDTVALHLAGVKAAIDFLRQFPKPVEPEPDSTTCGPMGPSSEKGEDGDDEGEGGSQQGLSPDDFNEEGDEPESKPGQGETDESDEDGEDESTGGSSEDQDDDESDDEWDEGGNPRDEEEDEDDEDGESDEPEPDSSPADPDDDGSAVIENPKDSVPNFDGSIESSGTNGDKAMNRQRDEIAKTRETISGEETRGDTVRINRKPTPKKNSWYDRPKADLGVAHEVRLAFESTRFSHDEWGSGHQTGRFRSRDAARAASGDLNVFSRRENESSTRVHLAMLIDYSSSMSGREHTAAMKFAATVAAAMSDSPVYRQSVWKYIDGPGSDTSLDLLWQTGQIKDIEEALADGGQPQGCTPTGEALYALGREMSDDRRGDEALLLLSLTDGAPDKPEIVKWAAEHWGDRRIAVVGVRVGIFGANKNVMDSMRDQYGDDRVIEFTGSWKDLAEDVGATIGHALAGTL
jgi:Mg-chelatase subunit ChlD